MSRAIFVGSVMGGMSILCTVAGAHPGHGATDGQTAGHYLGEPSHLLTWLSTAGVAMIITIAIRRSRAAGIDRS